MTTHEEYDELVAAFALDALDAPQCDAFRSHLASCPQCQAALADFRRVSAGIGLTVPAAAPPAALRARTLAFATSTGSAAVVAHPSAPVRVATVDRPSRGSQGWLAAAAAAILAVGAGGYAWSLRSQIDSLRVETASTTARLSELRGQLAAARVDNARMLHTLDVVNAPDVVKIDLRGQPGAPNAIGEAFWSQTRGMAFNADKLPALDKNRVYQLWVIPAGDHATPVSAGLFAVDAAGKSLALNDVPVTLPAPHVVAITIEPAGGSAGPTSTPVLVGSH